MRIDHVRFCVEDAKTLREWFVNQLGFRAIASGNWNNSHTEVINSGSIYFVLCSPLAQTGFATSFLQRHPSGVSDVALIVEDIDIAIAHAKGQGATLRGPIQTEYQPHGRLRWATIHAWESLTHTLVERTGITTLLPTAQLPTDLQATPIRSVLRSTDGLGASQRNSSGAGFTDIDHVVLNVEKGELAQAASWYERVLQFQPQQRFEIQTKYSALCSQVMRHPVGQVQFPINEPASQNSQIQEFLQVNRGAGIQHIALATVNLVETIATLRKAGLSLIQVPSTYYTQLRQRPSFPFSNEQLQALETQQILADWQEDPSSGVLLQTFTQPIFREPTFFLELIERQTHPLARQPERAKGFGEGNFRALFEAIEREQMKRGSLTPSP